MGKKRILRKTFIFPKGVEEYFGNLSLDKLLDIDKSYFLNKVNVACHALQGGPER